LSSFLAPQQVPEVRSAAVTALARTGRSETPKLLLANWAAHSPSLRNQILDALAAREAWALAVLEAVESGQVAAAQFDARRLQQLKSSGRSLMPEGIERDVPPVEMSDILAYLKQAAPPPKQIALNQPEVVQPFNDGSIRLFASNCRAYGPTIKMEETFRALGWWNSQEDHCAWS